MIYNCHGLVAPRLSLCFACLCFALGFSVWGECDKIPALNWLIACHSAVGGWFDLDV